MDMKKFCEQILNDETIADIPMTFVYRIVSSVFRIINSGECFFYNNID